MSEVDQISEERGVLKPCEGGLHRPGFGKNLSSGTEGSSQIWFGSHWSRTPRFPVLLTTPTSPQPRQVTLVWLTHPKEKAFYLPTLQVHRRLSEGIANS